MRKALVLVCVVALLASAAALVGCGSGSSSQTPKQVMQAFCTAAKAGDTHTTWSLMSAETQKAIGSENKWAVEFRQFVPVGTNYTVGKATIIGNKGTVNVTIRNAGNTHTTSMPVIKENGVWKLV